MWIRKKKYYLFIFIIWNSKEFNSAAAATTTAPARSRRLKCLKKIRAEERRARERFATLTPHTTPLWLAGCRRLNARRLAFYCTVRARIRKHQRWWVYIKLGASALVQELFILYDFFLYLLSIPVFIEYVRGWIVLVSGTYNMQCIV